MDIPTALYSISFIPYKFEKRYFPQSELLAYTNYIVDSFDIRKSVRTHHSVTRLTFDEEQFLWHVEVATGEQYAARFIVDTSGVLDNPYIPEIEDVLK